MSNSNERKIKASMHLLQNPLDDKGYYNSHFDEPEFAGLEDISKSRRILMNPYAHLDGEGGYLALKASSTSEQNTATKVPVTYAPLVKQDRSQNHSDSTIEKMAKNLQNRLWRERNKHWPSSTPQNPIEVLDPEIALKMIGFNCETVETLGFYRKNGARTEVAGEIDQSKKFIKISRQLPRSTYTFTLAHELGHAIMHSEMQALHRDRPMDGTRVARDRIEVEADKFAAYFLMPEKVLKDRFSTRFLTDSFELTDDTAFALTRQSLSEIQATHKSLRSLSRYIAEAEQYNGERFLSLANEFSVTRETLAIRLEELGLIHF